MLIKPTDTPKLFPLATARTRNEAKSQTGLFINLRTECSDSLDQPDFKSSTAPQRPLTSRTPTRGISGQATSHKLSSFKIKETKIGVKGSSISKDNTPQEKISANGNPNLLKQIPPLLKNYEGFRSSVVPNNTKEVQSASYRGYKKSDAVSQDLVSSDIPFQENITQLKESQMVINNKYQPASKKKSPSVGPSPRRIRKSTLAEVEKGDVTPNHIIYSSTAEFQRGVFNSISLRLMNSLPTTKLHTMPSQTKDSREDKNMRILGHGVEERLYSERECDYREQEVKKTKEQPTSQTMFRMKQFRKAKDTVAKKNKESVNVAVESSLKSFNQRQMTAMSSRPGSKDWKNDILKTLDTEGERFATEENGRGWSRLATPQDVNRTSQRALTVLPDPSKISKTIKLTDYQKEKQEIIQRFFTEDGTLRILENEKPFENQDYQDLPINVPERRKSTVTTPKADKVDMKKFLMSISSPKAQITHGQNYYLSKEKAKNEGERTPKPKEQNTVDKGGFEKQMEAIGAKGFEKQATRKMEKHSSDPVDKRIGQFRHNNTEAGSSADTSMKTRKMLKNSLTTNSPRDSFVVKPTDKKPSKFAEKETLLTEVVSPKKKRINYNPIADMEELSQISIKQFEMSNSWDTDTFDLVKPSYHEVL